MKISSIDKKSLDKKKLSSIVSSFSDVKFTVFGDLILDEYLIGNPSRISREAPVIILKFLKSSFALGGSSNAANNAAALGAKVTLIGSLGDDIYKKEFEKLCKDSKIELKVLTDSKRPTTTKTRVISTSNKDPHAGTGIKQQVLRIDREFSADIDEESSKELSKLLATALEDTDLVLLSDYSNGNLNHNNSQDLIELCTKAGKKTIIDSTGDLRKFKGAYSFTPNQPDLEAYLATTINSEDELFELANKAKIELQANNLLLTRGAKGMALIQDQGIDLIPAFNISEVFDVTGAGDTVAAVYSLAIALEASPLEAAILGNLAASLVVKKSGTATISQQELTELINSF
jgi:D-glycero-beta-D-manno-heptose-7-phosphate kinase